MLVASTNKKIHTSIYGEEPEKVKKNTNIFHKTFFNNICLTNSIHLNYIYGCCFFDRIEIKKYKNKKKKNLKKNTTKMEGADYLPS
jgi:hypothetical protein